MVVRGAVAEQDGVRGRGWNVVEGDLNRRRGSPPQGSGDPAKDGTTSAGAQMAAKTAAPSRLPRERGLKKAPLNNPCSPWAKGGLPRRSSNPFIGIFPACPSALTLLDYLDDLLVGLVDLKVFILYHFR